MARRKPAKDGPKKPLHLVKLCVGVESLEQFQTWAEGRLESLHAAGEREQLFHVTRMTPKRAEEVVGNSLYWVIKGHIQCRQQVIAIEPFQDTDGVRRCRLVFDNAIVPTEWRRKKAFQGWRYFKGRPPPDLPHGQEGLPPALHRELAELGLL